MIQMVVFVRMVKTHEGKSDPKITQAKNIFYTATAIPFI
jgi:hypothetical protein